MLRTLPIDPAPLNFVSAGTPEPLMVWGEENGRRVLTDRQEKDEHGTPLWTCYLMPTSAERPEVINVRVPAHHQPVLGQFSAVTAVGLETSVRVGRDGKLAMYWSAAEIRDGSGNRRDKTPDSAAA